MSDCEHCGFDGEKLTDDVRFLSEELDKTQQARDRFYNDLDDIDTIVRKALR